MSYVSVSLEEIGSMSPGAARQRALSGKRKGQANIVFQEVKKFIRIKKRTQTVNTLPLVLISPWTSAVAGVALVEDKNRKNTFKYLNSKKRCLDQ